MSLFYREEVTKHHACQISIYFFLPMQQNDTFIAIQSEARRVQVGRRSLAAIGG